MTKGALNKEWRCCVINHAHGKCEICGSAGRDCHHIIPKSIDKSKQYDPHNGVYLCKDCHHIIHHSPNPRDLIFKSSQESKHLANILIEATNNYPSANKRKNDHKTETKCAYDLQYTAWGCHDKKTPEKIVVHNFKHMNIIY